jgi:hypothetical protein
MNDKGITLGTARFKCSILVGYFEEEQGLVEKGFLPACFSLVARYKENGLLKFLRLFFWEVRPFVGALDLLYYFLHFLTLSGPFFCAHLQFFPKQLIVWLTVAAEQAIRDSRELAIIVVD